MRRHATALAALLFSSAIAAEGQLAAPVRQCIDGYNNKLRLVSQQAGKSARACVRAAAEGTESDPDTCITANADGKIAAREAKVAALYTDGRCDGSEPIQRGAAIGNAAHRGAVTDLAHDLFGDPVTPAIVGLDTTDAGCTDLTMKRSVQAFAAIAKGHRQCKMIGLQSGAVVDAATLDAACGTFAQLDGSGKARQRLTKLTEDVAARCAASTAGLATLFPGLAGGCHTDGAALGDCVAARTTCRACLAVNEADGQPIDCDLVDDGTDNQSCVASPLGSHTCTFATGSQILIRNTALPLSLVPSGSLTLSCGTADAAQTSSCTCALDTFAPIVLPAIGDVCITPAPGCPAGGIDCDGGSGRNVDFVADHNIGTCTSNLGCAATCEAHCTTIGAGYARRVSSCEGYCQGGVNDELPCAQESDCPGADCVGNPTFHGDICNCTCAAAGLDPPGGAGELQCAIGYRMHVELPSDGECLDAPIESFPPQCVGLTTATATGISFDLDNMSGLTYPPFGEEITGTSLACATIEAGSITGLKLVGYTLFFDSTLGDNFTRFSFVCQ